MLKLLAVVAVAFSEPAWAAANGDVAIAEALQVAWNRGDGQAWGEQFWPEARFVNAVGAVSDGQQAITKLHARLFASPFKGSRNTFTVAHVIKLGSDRLLVELDGKAEGLTNIPASYPIWPDGSVHAHLMFVSEQRGGEWRILYAQNTVVTPTPGS